jgi:predicted N-formylglutamate amidohydrolase
MNKHAGSRVLLVCEHASNRIPEHYENLGLNASEMTSHAAWDLGALKLSTKLSRLLDASLVISNVSRLVYDCNRPPSSPDAMRPKSEQIFVPGSMGLTSEEKTKRVASVYEPFKNLVAQMLTLYSHQPILVTIHSYTRIYNNKRRDVDIGLIFDEDDRLTQQMMKASHSYNDYKFMINEPYNKKDGVTHTLKVHGTDNGLINVMIEVCNDLIETDEQVNKVSMMLAQLLRTGLSELRQDISLEPR